MLTVSCSPFLKPSYVLWEIVAMEFLKFQLLYCDNERVIKINLYQLLNNGKQYLQFFIFLMESGIIDVDPGIGSCINNAE